MVRTAQSISGVGTWVKNGRTHLVICVDQVFTPDALGKSTDFLFIAQGVSLPPEVKLGYETVTLSPPVGDKQLFTSASGSISSASGSITSASGSISSARSPPRTVYKRVMPDGSVASYDTSPDLLRRKRQLAIARARVRYVTNREFIKIAKAQLKVLLKRREILKEDVQKWVREPFSGQHAYVVDILTPFAVNVQSMLRNRWEKKRNILRKRKRHVIPRVVHC